jgi:hypothetical protein
MVARKLLNVDEAAILDILFTDSDSDIDCSDDESEQETLINDNIYKWKVIVQIKSACKGFRENLGFSGKI